MRLTALGMAAVMVATAVPVTAQSQGEAELRLRKVEAEVRALQRRVFPEGAGRTLEPEITTGPAATTPAGAPSTTAVTDILARLDALEGQLRQLTATQEENTNGLRLLRERVAVLEGAATPPPVTVTPAATPTPTPAPARTTTTAARPAATGPSAERLAAVQAIAKPATGDAAADDYAYGFRLWEAKFYPEAVQQLTAYVEKYPRHAQISYGRNLLGRAYLDDGRPREAAPWFLRNYQADKEGARAGDSLLYLGEAMTALADTKRACIALAEFAETYPALATGRLKSQYDAARGRAKCS